MSPDPSRPARFRRGDRLRAKVEFDRAYQSGFRIAGRLLVVVVAPRPQGRARLGISASRRVGSAPTRNRIKRCIRESFRRSAELRCRSVDLVVNVRIGAGAEPSERIVAELEQAWRRVIQRLPA